MRFRAIAAAILATGKEALDKQESAMKATLDKLEAARHEYEPIISPGEERRLADEAIKAWKDLCARLEIPQPAGGTAATVDQASARGVDCVYGMDVARERHKDDQREE